MKTSDYLKEVLSTSEGHDKWLTSVKEKGYSPEKIASINMAMLDADRYVNGGKMSIPKNKVWLKWSNEKEDYVEIPLKENEEVEIYIKDRSLAQILRRNGIPVNSQIYYKESEFGKKASEVYNI